MEWLNYHHLLYFWTTAREGSLSAAATRLLLTQPTLSTQIKALERSLGVRLFERSGRRLQLTESGQMVLRYADDIFSIGRELLDSVRGRPTGAPLRLQIGIVDVVPKIITNRLLIPALAAEPVRLVCYEGKIEQLVARLAIHELDAVIADAPIPPHLNLKAFNHQLGECGTTIFAEKKSAPRLRRNFPRSLDGAKWLLPTSNHTVRRSLDRWFESNAIRPVIAGEFEDSALKKVFAQQGLGCFAGPTAIEREICRQYGVSIVGRIDGVREQYYAITMERKFHHPAIIALARAARGDLLKPSPEERS